jgi:3-methyladenine DNA glycosylase AlkD
MIMEDIVREIKKHENKEKARILLRFFKTGQGEYGEGDVFLGIVVPEQRVIARKFKDIPLAEVQKLLKSLIHEHRMIALMILIEKYKEADEAGKEKIFKLYLRNTRNINNWDLVDLSCPQIVGDFLLKRDRSILYSLAGSKNLWERRIAIISTFPFIKNNQFGDTFKIAEMLLDDEHDLLHKAVGWMLREAGKRDKESEVKFLNRHYKSMPRTMLRYAIEKFPEKERIIFLTRR